MSSDNINLAVQANIQSITLAMKGDREGWLALYADDAIVKDPVGKSPFDASGEGHRGKAGIAKFWDTVIGPSNLTINVHTRIPSGSHSCAVHQTAINDMGKGKTAVDMIAIYDVNAEGKITAMSAYWSWADMEAQLKKLGFM
ncbi:MAG: nuclear transport factor 2 family protein [Pseudomonadales bacterium]|jgi:steroid delta-isomerase|nr:nuclear transport factor 2 family protein [Cellvibrionales bacterium]MBP8030102.1 nuclear transport factor 2 family protein [Pseudomonadales bacterium]